MKNFRVCKCKGVTLLTRGFGKTRVASCIGSVFGLLFLFVATLATPTQALSAPSSGAGSTICHAFDFPIAPAPWTNNFTFPKFNPTLGTLSTIDFELNCCLNGSIGVENLSGSPAGITSMLSGLVSLTRPDGSSISACLIPAAAFNDAFPSFDGTEDFGGSSGTTHAGIQVSQTASVTSPPPVSDLALFTGTGNISLPISAKSSFLVYAGPYESIGDMSACASGSVCYNYVP